MKFVLIIFIVLHFACCDYSNNKIVETFKYADQTSISDQCRKSLELYLENLMDLSNEDRWALKMLDASSKIPVGLLYSYNFGELGNFKQCIETKSQNGLVTAQYCLGFITLSGIIDNSRYAQTNLEHLRKQVHLRTSAGSAANGDVTETGYAYEPTWAVCLPSNCSEQEVLTIFNFMRRIGLEFITFGCQTIEDTNPPMTAAAIATIVVLVVVAGIMIASTSYDLYCIKSNTVPIYKALVAFSIYSNGKKLFTMSPTSAELPCLNGMRFISILWVLAGHTFSVRTSGPLMNLKDVMDWTDSLASMIIVSGTLSVDTFFVVSGALLVYVYTKSQYNGIKFNIFKFYVHRYIRLTPAYAAAILVSANLLEYLASGPKWIYFVQGFQQPCKDYWWSSLLYVQNYVNASNMCMGHTWYLNIDMQLYVISPVVLLLLWKLPKVAFSILIFSGLTSIAWCFYIAYDKQLLGILTNFNYSTVVGSFSNDYYLVTHTRAPAWIIGVILGYFVAGIKFQNIYVPRLNKLTNIGIWIVCLSVMLTCVFGGHSTLRGPDYDRVGNSFYIALLRPVWSICVAWVIWACVFGYGGIVNSILSLPIFQVLNRLTYSIYLIHVTFMYLIVFSMKSADYFTVFYMIYSFWGLAMLSLGLSIVWTLAFESPMIILEKTLFS